MSGLYKTELNRVLGRVKEGKTMTANNIQAKDEILKEFPEFKF